MEDGHDRGGTKDIRRLTPALKFLSPYKTQIICASVALVITAGATLLIGQGVRLLIDSGFSSGNNESLDEALIYFVSFVVGGDPYLFSTFRKCLKFLLAARSFSFVTHPDYHII